MQLLLLVTRTPSLYVLCFLRVKLHQNTLYAFPPVAPGSVLVEAATETAETSPLFSVAVAVVVAVAEPDAWIFVGHVSVIGLWAVVFGLSERSGFLCCDGACDLLMYVCVYIKDVSVVE